MAGAQVTGRQIKDGSIQREDLDTVTSGQAVITKAGNSTDIVVSTSTGADVGTGDVTLVLTTTGVAAGTVIKPVVDSKGRVISSAGAILDTDLPASGASAGTYQSVTIDIYGRVLTGGALTSAMLPGGSGYYIQNGVGSQSADFNITGIGQVGTLVLVNAGGKKLVINNAPSQPNDLNYVLPNNVGTVGQVMSTDGTGVLSFVSMPWTRSGTQVNLTNVLDKVTIGLVTNNAGVLGVEGGSIQLARHANIVSLIHFDGRAGSRQIIDVCGNRWSCGSSSPAALTTTQFKFGATSLSLNGTSQYVEFEGPNFSQFGIGSGSFTIEEQVRFNAVTGTQTLCDFGGTASGVVVRYVSGTGLQVVVAGSTFNYAWTPITGTWYHVAVVRNGTTLSAYIEGSAIGTNQTSSGTITCLYVPTLGSTGNLGGTVNRSNFFNGYVDEFRFTSYAVWTSGFAAPTAAWDYATYTQAPGTSTVVEAGFSMVSDGRGNASLQPTRRSFTAVFVLTENVANTTKYFYSWAGNGATQDDAKRSGSGSGVGNANSCSPIEVPFNGRISRAVLSVQGTGVNNGSVTYPCSYQTTFHRVGWAAENDPTVNSGTPVSLSFPLASGVGTFSVAATNAIVERTDLNISVNVGEKMALKFVNGGTAGLVGLTQQAVVTLVIEEVL